MKLLFRRDADGSFRPVDGADDLLDANEAWEFDFGRIKLTKCDNLEEIKNQAKDMPNEEGVKTIGVEKKESDEPPLTPAQKARAILSMMSMTGSPQDLMRKGEHLIKLIASYEVANDPEAPPLIREMASTALAIAIHNLREDCSAEEEEEDSLDGIIIYQHPDGVMEA